jgi:signal transduction histidine kinase
MAFAVSLAFSLAMLLLGAAVYYASHSALSRQMDTSIQEAQTGLVSEFHTDGLAGLEEAIRQREGSGRDTLGYALFDAKGHRFAGHLNATMPHVGWATISFLDPVEGPDPARALTTRLAGGYRLLVAGDLEPVEQIDVTILSIFAVAFAGVLLIGIVGALAFGGYLRRRLARIEETAGAIVAGDLSRRMVVGPREDEFDRVAASLNLMLDRIASLVANLRQVTTDLAHDLRTPLARLRNQLETLGNQTRPGPARATVEDAVERADEVLKLFEAILRISELEQGSLRSRFAPVDLCKLIRELGETHAPLAEDTGRSLTIEAEGQCIVYGDREFIAQALINLIENAFRHTPEGTPILIGASESFQGPCAFVQDYGPGIAKHDRQRVFERFVRLEAARSSPGHGLGLSLVRAIADAHDAEIMTSGTGGLGVFLRFPPCQCSGQLDRTAKNVA